MLDGPRDEEAPEESGRSDFTERAKFNFQSVCALEVYMEPAASGRSDRRDQEQGSIPIFNLTFLPTPGEFRNSPSQKQYKSIHYDLGAYVK